MSCPCYGCTHGLTCPHCTAAPGAVRLTWTHVSADEITYEWACVDCGHRWTS